MTAEVAVLAGAWGVITAAPVLAWSHRRAVARRLPTQPRVPRARRAPAWGPVGRVIGGVVRRRASARADASLDAELPGAFDLLVVAVGAGGAPTGAVEMVATWGPERVATAFRRVLGATALGESLPDALTEMAAATPRLASMADVLTASALLGAPAAGALTRLAEEARAAARRRAETRARVLPVKLLFPLVFLVLPAFGLLTVAPALISAMARL